MGCYLSHQQWPQPCIPPPKEDLVVSETPLRDNVTNTLMTASDSCSAYNKGISDISMEMEDDELRGN